MDTSRAALRRPVTGTHLPGLVGTSVPGWVGREYAAGLASVCLYGANIVDPDQLARITHVPALFWVGVFLVVNLAALAVGGFLLAGQWLPENLVVQ